MCSQKSASEVVKNYLRLLMIILANLQRLENKDFLLPASDCVSTDANDSQLIP